MKYFRAVLTTNKKQCNGKCESVFDSFNSEQATAKILLELRENFRTSTAATCFISEKIKYILDIDRQIHIKILIKSLRKDIEDAAPP